VTRDIITHLWMASSYYNSGLSVEAITHQCWLPIRTNVIFLK